MSIYPDKKNGKLTGRFRVEVQLNGRRARGRFQSLKEAQDAQTTWSHQFAAGELPTPVKERSDNRGKPHTLAQLIEKAKGKLWLGKATEQQSFARLERSFKVIGLSSSIDSLQTEDIDKLIDFLIADGSSEANVNRYLSAVSKALKWAKERKYRTEELPTFSWFDEDNGRIRWLTADEENGMYSRVPLKIAKAIRAAVETGMRRGELLGLERRDIEPQWARLWETKTNSPRSIPLTQETFRDLRWLVDNGMPAIHELRYYWDKARELMGLLEDPDFVFHACRHTCATRLVMRNVNLRIVQKWMGHKRIETTLRYAHVNDQMLLGALGSHQQPMLSHKELEEMTTLDPIPHGGVSRPPAQHLPLELGAGVVKLADTQDLGSHHSLRSLTALDAPMWGDGQPELVENPPLLDEE